MCRVAMQSSALSGKIISKLIAGVVGMASNSADAYPLILLCLFERSLAGMHHL